MSMLPCCSAVMRQGYQSVVKAFAHSFEATTLHALTAWHVCNAGGQPPAGSSLPSHGDIPQHTVQLWLDGHSCGCSCHSCSAQASRHVLAVVSVEEQTRWRGVH